MGLESRMRPVISNSWNVLTRMYVTTTFVTQPFTINPSQSCLTGRLSPRLPRARPSPSEERDSPNLRLRTKRKQRLLQKPKLTRGYLAWRLKSKCYWIRFRPDTNRYHAFFFRPRNVATLFGVKILEQSHALIPRKSKNIKSDPATKTGCWGMQSPNGSFETKNTSIIILGFFVLHCCFDFWFTNSRAMIFESAVFLKAVVAFQATNSFGSTWTNNRSIDNRNLVGTQGMGSNKKAKKMWAVTWNQIWTLHTLFTKRLSF